MAPRPGAVDKLRGANRSPHGVPTHLFCTGNPGGPGHLQVKEHFRLGEGGAPSGVPWLDEQGLSRVFIKSFLADNRILVENDPKYVKQLTGIKDPILRRAWLDGDWEVYIGQAFQITHRHILKDAAPPPYVALYMTFDWGFGKPFSIGWWWVDHEDRLYRFSEWYGWNGVEDEGLRMPSLDQSLDRILMANWRTVGARSPRPECGDRTPPNSPAATMNCDHHESRKRSVPRPRGTPSGTRAASIFRAVS